MQNLNLYFSSVICLRNKYTNQYFNYDQNSNIVNACGAPPSIKGNQADINKSYLTDRFKIINAVNRQMKSNVIYGSKVFLINTQGQYLACLANGDLKLDKPSLDEGLNSMLFKTSGWVIQDINNTLNKKPITVYDDVILKSVYGNLMICAQNNLIVTGNGSSISKNTIWNIMKSNIPFIPEWVYLRPTIAKHMTLSSETTIFNKNQLNRKDDKRLLSSFSLQVQQWYLVEDLLDIMLGFQGVFIKKRGQGKSLNLIIQPHLQSASCDQSLSQLCQKIFTLPLNYLIIQNYIAINSIENGTVCQAFAGALRILLKQYKMMIVQLDQQVKNGLTLQKLWYYIQPSSKIMQSLVALLRSADRLKGGLLLSCIFTMLNNTTDQQIHGIYSFLFNKVIIVYINLLEKWIYNGIINDKHQQFMIYESKQIQKDNKQFNYWDQRFILKKQLVPIFFQKQAEIILMTGKYLNVISQCGKKIINPHFQDLYHNLNKYIEDQNFTQPIHKAYNWANQELNKLIMEEKKLIQLLNSMKGYFFLQFGDFFVHFLEVAQKDLSETRNKPISIEKLQSLLQLSIKTSTATNDPFNQEVSCKIDNITIFQQINRIKALEPKKFNYDPNQKPLGATSGAKYLDFFTLDYKVKFPLNLIINRKSLNKYQTLFRHLFWCKYIQRQLNNTWLVLQSTKETPLPCYMPAYLLNQRMLHYCKSLVYYLSYEVIQLNWLKLMDNLKKVKRFEDIIQYHDQFLDTCLKESLLMNEILLKTIIIDLGNSCQGFFAIKTYISSLSYQKPNSYNKYMDEEIKNQTILQKRKRKTKQNLQSVNTFMEQKNFSHFVKGFIVCFDKALKKLLEEVCKLIGKHDGHLVNLLARLDSQGYYTQRLRIALTNQIFIQK